MKKRLLKSALLGAAALGVVSAAQAHTTYAKFYFKFYGTHAGNDMITIPCEATDYLAKPDVEYNLDPGQASPLGNNTGVIIKYKPANQLNNADNIVIKLHNAVFGNSLKKCWLVYYEHNGIDTNDDGVGDTNFDINGDSDANDMIVVAETRSNVQGKSSIYLNVGDAGRGIPNNAIYYLWCAEEGEANLVDQNGDPGDPESPDNYTNYAPVIKITEDLYKPNTTDTCGAPGVGDKVCLSAEGYSCCGQNTGTIDGYTTNGEYCIIDTVCQFSLDMRSSLSIIDMYPRSLGNVDCTNSKSGLIHCYEESYEPGTAFVPEAGNDDILDSHSCTDLHAADGNIIINNDPTNIVDDDIVLGSGGWKGKFSASIYDVDNKYACDDINGHGMKKGPYEALDFAHDRMFIDNNGDETTPAAAHIPLNPGKACYAEATVENGDPNAGTSSVIYIRRDSTWTDDVYMGVNGKRLYWVRWGLKEKLTIIDPDNDVAYNVTLDEDAAAACHPDTCCYDADKTAYFKKWEPNGDEAYVPYMLNMNQFKVLVSNNSCWDAEIYARVWDSKGRVVDNVYLGKVGKNSVRILTGDYIFAKAKQELPDIGRGASPLYSMILTVGAPKRDVEFAGYDNRQGKTKMIPIYDLDAHEWTYRNVPFYQDTFEH